MIIKKTKHKLCTPEKCNNRNYQTREKVLEMGNLENKLYRIMQNYISEFTQFKKDDLKVNNRNNKCKY